jgi:RNA polymerase sigma-70 factor (ECF subfamily)
MSRAGDSDPASMFEELFRDTRTDLLAYLLRRAASAEDAADLLAETYLIAWRRLDAIPSGKQARLWLFGVARNLLMKGAGRRRSADALVERLAADLRATKHPSQPVEDERLRAIRSALAALDERDREIVTLTAWEGLSPSEIASATGMSANLVRVRLHRARARIRRDLESREPLAAIPAAVRSARASVPPCPSSD